MIKELLNFFKKEEKQQEKINYQIKVKTVYPDNYPKNGIKYYKSYKLDRLL